MNDLHTKEADLTERQTDSTLRWGGLAGILGSLLMLFTFGFVAAFVGMDITPDQSLTRFPDIRAARTVENSLPRAGPPSRPASSRYSGSKPASLRFSARRGTRPFARCWRSC